MEEAVVSFVVERFGDLLIQEAVFLYGVSERVQQMRDELERMTCFLKDADAKKEEDARVRNWVAEVRDVAYDAEDAIDKFIVKVAYKRRGGLKGALRRYTCIFKECRDLHMVGKEMEAIQNRINNISASRAIYGIENIAKEEGKSNAIDMQQQQRRSYPHVEEDIIGLEHDIATWVEKLIKKEDERHRVVSIVGMGGLGKTTLAKKLYNHRDVKSHFDCCAWAFISQQCKTRDVLREISKGMGTPTDKNQEMEREEELVEKLYKFLEDKLYLVVLDDIWSKTAWDSLKHAFPNGKMGSKIMLTTRNKEVALHVDAFGLIHEPRYLTEDESWELLCKKAFPAGTSCPAGMKALGKEMVAKCHGLPLAVVVLGGLLAKKSIPSGWISVKNSISLQLMEGEHGVEKILALSYNDLPYNLKPCFLYLGALFPEDYEIPAKKLFHLWIAEGFILQQGQESRLDIAKKWLSELIDRCMVGVAKWSSTGMAKSCRIHDLMRDLCVNKAKVENFLENFDEVAVSVNSSDVASTTTKKLRRLVLHTNHERYVSLVHSTPHIRTLSFIKLPNSSDLRLKSVFPHTKLLRILDLDNVSIKSLPSDIEKLVHLRYLGLRHTYIEKLPASIGNLQCLQTLDLRECYGLKEFPLSIGNIRSLQTLDLKFSPLDGFMPNVIWKLKELRHLHIHYNYYSCNLTINTLRNLETLHMIGAGTWMDKGLDNFTSLRKLGITMLTRSRVEIVLSSIALNSDCHLRSLYLNMSSETDGETFPDLEPLSRCHHLLKLYLDGTIVQLPLQWPPYLLKLTLWRSQLQQDPMPTLQNLPNLMCLVLGWKSFEGKEVVCSREGFPQLQFLHLWELIELEDWRVEEGAMPNLKILTIETCSKLKMIPEGLKFVTSLRELMVKAMPREIKDRIREGGEDYYKVQHIPYIKNQ